MRVLLYILPLFLVLIACNSTPGYVIGEDDMVSLLVDVHKGEAYVEMNSGSFYSDSLKKTFRQTIFMRHNVTQEQFDTSLMWYGHYIDQYKKVYDRVIERLEDEEKEIRLAAAREGQVTLAAGDSANLWNENRIASIRRAEAPIIFDVTADDDFKRGDVYLWAFRYFNVRGQLRVFFAIDYADGTTSFLNRVEASEGWAKLTLQSDSTKDVKRVYGMLSKPDMNQGEVVLLDSISLVRTRLEKSKYHKFFYQRIYKQKTKE